MTFRLVLPHNRQLQGGRDSIANAYRDRLRLVIDAGVVSPQSISAETLVVDGFAVVGTRSIGGSGQGWLGSVSTYVTARTTASNPSPMFEIPANSDWTVQFVIDNVSGAWGTHPGLFRAGSTFLGSTFIVQNGTDRRPWVRVNGTDVLRPASGDQWVTGQRLNLIVRFKNSARAEAWWDGSLKHSATHSTSQEALLGINGVYALMKQSVNENTGGNLAAFRFWTRYLDDAQMSTLAQSEHALYEPRQIWSPGSAAGGGGFQSAWVRNRSQVIGAGVR